MSPADSFSSMIIGLQNAELTRSEIVQRCHLSRSTVWRLAEGVARQPSFEVVDKVQKLHDRFVNQGAPR